MLKVTKIHITKYEQDSMRAFVNLTFNGELTIDGFKLMDGEKGHWLAPPSRKTKDGWSNIIKLSKQLKEDLIDQVMDEYEKTPDSNSSQGGSESSDRGSSRRRR